MITLCMTLAMGIAQDETHLDHVHLNTRDANAAKAFYEARFQPGPVRFHEVAEAPPASLISAVWHIGWGSPDPRAEYRRQLGLGTRYSTPPTNLAEVGPNFFYSYVEGPDKAMIEINNAADTKFRHIHLLSEDPVAAAEWYMKYLGLKTMGGRPLSRNVVRLGGADIGVTANLTIDGVYIGIFPASWAREQYAEDWKGVSQLVSTAGRVVDHIAFRVPDLNALLAQMKAGGVRTLDLPVRSGDTGVYVEGPDRIVIELVAAR
ncbi:MAG: VOC family protein [Bryobacteraceae bacterium]|nr:VOC family protein [Bryobacteraceae bacterium]